MSLPTEIQRLQNNVNGIVSDTHAILDAIAAKGVAVPESSTLHDCPGLIDSISGGGDYGGVLLGNIVYPTIKIGNQTWTTQNLAYAFNGLTVDPGTFDNTSPKCSSYGGNRDPFFYGYYYNYKAVQLLEQNKSTLIPGWRVPTKNDWDILFSYIGSSLYSKCVIEGTYEANNDSHLSIILNGYRSGSTNYGLGSNGQYFCLDNNGTGFARAFFNKPSKTAITEFTDNFDRGIAIRLIKEI